MDTIEKMWLILRVCLFYILMLIVVIAYQLVLGMWPKIVSYKTWIKDKKKEHTVVILAGSFNPPHNGHIAMLHYLSDKYDQVIAVIGVNPNKQYDVHPNDREKILSQLVEDTTNIRVEVVSNYVWRFAKKERATILYRGIRTWERDGKEEQQLQRLNIIGPILLGPLSMPIPTFYLEGNPEYNHVSSTMIRQICCSNSNHEAAAKALVELKLVPPKVGSTVARLYGPKSKGN